MEQSSSEMRCLPDMLARDWSGEEADEVVKIKIKREKKPINHHEERKSIIKRQISNEQESSTTLFTPKVLINLACLLIIVPIEPCSCFQLAPSESSNFYDTISQLPTTQHQDAFGVAQIDWAKRLAVHDNLASVNNMLTSDKLKQQRQLTQNYQSTILKNLINSTLESIAPHQRQFSPEQPRILAVARDLVRQHAGQQQQQQQQQLAPSLKYLPTSVGNRLYNFLFPQASSHQAITGQPRPQLGQSMPEHNHHQNEPPIQMGPPSNGQDTYLSNKPAGRTSGSGANLISLSAPYEQRPRTALKSHSPSTKSLSSASLLPAASQPAATSDKWPREVSDQDASQYATSDSLGAPESDQEASVSEDMGSQQVGGEESNGDQAAGIYEPSTDNQNEFNWSATNQIGDDTGNFNNEHQKVNLLVADGDQEQQQQTFGHQTPDEQQVLVTTNFGSNRSQNGLEHHLVPVADESVSEEQSATGSNHQQAGTAGDDEEANSIMDNEQNQLQINETTRANLMTNRLNNLTTSMLVSPAYGDTPTTQQGDDLLLTVQLPSQYDANIRLPPEGHYDDYFKPIGNLQTADNQSTANLLGQENLQDLSLAFVDNAHSITQTPHHDNNNNNNGSEFELNQQQANQTNASMPIDYTMQYYMNQYPLRQSETVGDHNVEFITTNKTFSSGTHNIGRHRLEGEQNAHLEYHPLHQTNNESSSLTRLVVNQDEPQVGHDYSRTTNHSQQQRQYNQASNQTNNTEDNIQLIVANSSSNPRDPNNDEKLITYTSEGRNFTKPAGQKSARNTFVNKDLNELPPSDNLGNMGPTMSPIKLVSTGSPLWRPDVTIHQDQQRQKAGLDDSVPDQSNASAGNNNEDSLDNENVAELGEGLLQNTQFGGRRQPKGANLNQIDRSGGGNRNRSNHNNYNYQNEQIRSRRQREYNQPKHQANQIDQRHSNNKYQHHNDGNKASRQQRQQQQTVRRPQVTEAKFNPKDLPMSAPTPLPSITESTVSTIVDMPSKVKRLRHKQPDKNELMNELLTALDRVKTAIYKLQPLTAKMNAMYRKSITSNTRDIIMDSHKGTYSKRYPPGDYDDTYDRVHPSEVLERQGSSLGRSSARKGRQVGVRSALRTHTGGGGGDSLDPSGSTTAAVYLPAPRELLEDHNLTKRNVSANNGTESALRDEQQMIDQYANIDLDESSQPIVATGIGRRIGNGRIRAQMTLSSPSGGRIIYDNEDYFDQVVLDPTVSHNIMRRNASESGNTANRTTTHINLDNSGTNLDAALDDEQVQSPLFGYRITIYQSPESDNANESLGEVIGDSLMQNDDRTLSYRLLDGVPQDVADDDTLATSESSVALSQTMSIGTEPGEPLDEGESKKQVKSSKEGEEEKKHKKSKKEKGDKKGEKSSKHHSKGKKGFEEHKKKKEFKKIKHNKGVMSKESHKLHRDKHVKAHDRGAAKEKALKERTQIEFFEREQIVDDEFEKGKKSTIKAGWASGHDAKKTNKESYGGDSMSMGGSHVVKHVDVPMVASESGGYSENGHGHSMETSSGKQSNKFIKKNMESKGKKFKGWREKGYKIITETEFIDRGSLHDSAYKKRDKGAAHHQKFKKHEASSEGHQGAVHELHKKSHKKEEKKSKMEEKKKEMKDKEEDEKSKKAKKEAEKKHDKDNDHEQEESAPTMASAEPTARRATSGRSPLSRPVAAGASTLRPLAMGSHASTTSRPESLVRLLSADHDEHHQVKSSSGMVGRHEISANKASGGPVKPRPIIVRQQTNDTTSVHGHHSDFKNDLEIGRRSDDDGSPTGPSQSRSRGSSARANSSKDNNTATTTVFDIVDNSTGRHLNKNKLAAYELGEYTTTGSGPKKTTQTNESTFKPSDSNTSIQKQDELKLLENLIKIARSRKDKKVAELERPKAKVAQSIGGAGVVQQQLDLAQNSQQIRQDSRQPQHPLQGYLAPSPSVQEHQLQQLIQSAANVQPIEVSNQRDLFELAQLLSQQHGQVVPLQAQSASLMPPAPFFVPFQGQFNDPNNLFNLGNVDQFGGTSGLDYEQD